MMYRDLDKQVIKENSYTVLSKITLLNDGTVYTEEDSIVDWNYEDYRYVPDTGFVGQFVERLLDGNLQDIPDDKIFENQEINLQIGIVNGIDDITTWYDYGNFLITKVEETDTSGNYKFESSDYTKKFNQVYEDTIAYPCLSLDLANNVCGQVDITMDTKGNADYYIVGEEGLSAGDYAFKVGTTYYKFTTTSDLVKNDVLMLIEYYNRLYVKTVRYDEETGYTVTRTFLTFTTGDTVGDYSLLTTRSTGYVDFTNNDFVIENNQYEEQDTCRKVMQDIGKLAYSWVRIGTDNKLYIDFNQMSQASVDDYDKLTTNEYYVSKKQDLYYGPVNKVLIGMSSVDGENLYETSEDYTEETECAIKIYDNNLTYTEELRAIALKGCERLFGLTYMPLEIETIGHPWLEGNELIKLTNLDGEELYTYPFNRSIKYSGYIEGNISSEAATIKNTEYEYESSIINQINRTSITVDKNNQTITSLVSQVGDAESNITELQQTTTGLTASVNYLNEEYEKNVVIKKDAEGNPIEIEDAGNYPLEDFKIYGNCEQDGEPSTLNPVEVQTVTSKTTTVDYSGSSIDIDYSYDQGLVKVEESDKEFEGNTYQEQTTQSRNLLDGAKPNDYYMASSTFQNNIIKVSSTATNTLPTARWEFNVSTNDVLRYSAIIQNTNGQVVLQCWNGSSWVSIGGYVNNYTDGTTAISKAYTNSNGYSKLRLLLYSSNVIPSGNSESSYKNVIATINNSDVSYTPFVPNSPSPDYPQPINVATGLQDVNVVGKNLLDLSILEQGIYSNSAIPTLGSTTDARYRAFRLTLPMGTYTINTNKQLFVARAFSSYDYSSVLTLGIPQRLTSNSAFTITQDTTIYLSFRKYDGTNWNDSEDIVWLNKGSTSTTYEPYIGNTYSINLGKNLLKPKYDTFNMSGVVCTYTDKGLLLNGTPTANHSVYLFDDPLPPGNYIINGVDGGSNSTYQIVIYKNGTIVKYLTGATDKYAFTVNDGDLYAFRFYIYLAHGNFDNVVLPYQIERGSTCTSYSPYFTPIELCKIGNYQDRIFKSSGKNLFDKDTNNFIQGYYLDNNGVETAETNWGVYYIPIEPNKSYSISNCQTNGGVSFCWFTENKTFISRIGQKQNRDNMVAPNNAYYLGLSIVWNTSSSAYDNFFMLNEGSTPLPYEPYGSGKWYLHKEIGKVVFDGTETGWYKTSDTSASVFVIANQFNNRDTTQSASSISNYFKYQFANSAGKFYFGSTYTIALCMETTYTLETFKTWLSTHPTSVYYVLATPTCNEITNTTLINELESINNFTLYSPLTHYITTSEDLPVISNFSVSTLPYEVISIEDENENKLNYKPLFRNLELCKVEDNQDYLYLYLGKWYKHEEIGKIVSYNGETITTDYISTTGELSTGATVYYVLQDTREIEITDEEVTTELNRLMQNNINKGYNKILLNDPICEKLAITYLTDSILNDTYASKAQLSMTNNSISALVQQTNSLESNLASLNIDVDGISTAVESVETVTTNLENSINYLAVDMSANSLIIPTNEENKPYLTNTYTIPFTATFKGTSVNPTVTTSSASVTGITLTFGTGVINVGVSSATAIANVSNSFVINFSYTSDGQTYVVSKTLNVALSVKGEDGKDGTSVTILGSYNTLADLQAAHPTGNAGDSYMVGNDLYVWNVASLAWVDVGQIKGTDGINSYIYIRYSENPDGNPMVTTPTSTTQYIGVVTTNSSTAPTSYGSYTWSKYAGNNGETTYLHIKYSEDGSTFVPASADAGEGDTPSAWVGVLTDTNEEASDEFDDYTWYKFTEDIDDDLLRLQNDIVQNASDIDSNYKAIMKNFDSYATADTVATLKSRVETLETDDAYAINIIRDLQVNGVSQVRTEKGFTFNDSGMTIDATNSVTKSITDTNGITVLDKSGSSQSELLFAGYDETSQSSVVRTENLKVRKFLTIGTYSRLEDYEDGTGVFDV